MTKPAPTEMKEAIPPAVEIKIAEQAPEAQLPATTAGDGVPEEDPGEPEQQAKPKSRNLGTWEQFRDELNKRANEIGSQLPPNVSREKFLNASIAAIKATPEILTASPRSLMAALVKAAQDGLLPDGREGIITVYKGKGDPMAQWNPMFYGIRKRARELDGIIIDAQVVMEGDDFSYELGDAPSIHHVPVDPGNDWSGSDKGIAAYAIFRHPTEGIIHREVMWAPSIRRTQQQSRAKDSLMWTAFWTEAWKKTVGRRGAKVVPVSPDLDRMIRRDDESFEFGTEPSGIAISSRDIAARLAAGSKPRIVYVEGKAPVAANTLTQGLPTVDTKRTTPDADPSKNASPAGDLLSTTKDTAAPSKATPASPVPPAGETAKDQFERSTLNELSEELFKVTTPEGLALLAEEWAPTLELLNPERQATAREAFIRHPAARKPEAS